MVGGCGALNVISYLISVVNGFEQTISQLKINATHARWKDNDELADGLQEFIADMQKFQKECHPHLSCTND